MKTKKITNNFKKSKKYFLKLTEASLHLDFHYNLLFIKTPTLTIIEKNFY